MYLIDLNYIGIKTECCNINNNNNHNNSDYNYSNNSDNNNNYTSVALTIAKAAILAKSKV